MDIQAYIASGILEAFVLDALSAEERTRVAADVAAHPELATELRSIEEGLLAFAQAGSIAPPADMQERIWQEISAQAPASPGRTIPFTPEKMNTRSQQQRWQQAAILIVLLGSILVNLMFWMQRQQMEQRQQTIIARLDSLQHQHAVLADAMAHIGKEKDMMADTSMQAVLMKGAADGHTMAVMVYWKRATGESWLSLQKMPPPPQGMQYQMWVIQDGKPVSMGMVDTSGAHGDMITVPMRIAYAQAFAISLEPMGGNPTPTTVLLFGKTS